MARMHSRKKGKSGSTKPDKKTKPAWMRYQPKEIELLVVKLAKEGKTASEIGITLRDVYGIPSVKAVTGKHVSDILKAKGLLKEIPDDLMALIRKNVMIKKHLETNFKDMPAKRGLQLTESKIKRLVKYYKKNGKLDPNWKYDPEKIKVIVE
ncbi:30S ribosomal protein S15 [Candidatus Woesearchaeota archaeon]|nr:MAG: 30S ribosomal protein S15 [Candidatus Woesearchaeota archaeon]